MGPIMLDIDGMELSQEDKEILEHPLVGGIILFSRNYHDPKQLKALTTSMRASTNRSLLIAVDHEGGRVQRFREGFSKIPSMGGLLPIANHDLDVAQRLAHACGEVLAFELLSHSIDLSFTPVLDLCGVSEVIGDRAFSANVDEVVVLATALMQGMKSMGMSSTGKHFPGHGSVKADSHIAMPVDQRSFAQIEASDMAVFQRVNETGLLDAVMPAHVIYSEVDKHPAGFSRKWISEILRQQLQFTGVVFSDDLSMKAATVAGNASDRAAAALSAGCDMALVCNSRQSAIEVLDNLPNEFYRQSLARRLLAIHTFHAEKYQQRYTVAKDLIRRAQAGKPLVN